jgi:biotin transport system permease protein
MISGLYVPCDSALHKVSATSKLIALFGIGAGLVFIEDVSALMVLVGVLGLSFSVGAGLGFNRLWRATRPLLIWLVIIIAAQLWLADAATAATVSLRLLALVWTAALVTNTTRLSEMSDVLARGCAVLKPLGVSPDRIAFLIALTIRLIPAVFDIVRDVREAQRARGLERSFFALFVPVLTRVLRQAEALSEALVARGFERWESRS